MDKEKLHIAVFGHKRIPSNEGGIEVVVKELSVRMVAEGHSVTCFNRTGHHVSGSEFDGEKLDWYQGVRIRNVPTISQRGLSALTASFTAAIMSAFGRFDVTHIHAEGPAFMCWIPKLAGKKVIVTVHGLDHQRVKWGRFSSWYIRMGEKMAVRFADEIIVLSRHMQDYFRQTYRRETQFIPNGVNLPKLRKAMEIREKFGLEKDGYLLFLGRLVPEKGLEYLIQAFSRVKTDKKLVIAGGSSDTEKFLKELYAMVEPQGSRILFTGFVEGSLKDELYSNCYLYALCSDVEGMPLGLLEAMSYGTCCVVSDIPECAEVVEDKAALFSHGNVDALACVLQRLCDNPEETARLKALSAEFILKKYNWDDVTERTLSLY